VVVLDELIPREDAADDRFHADHGRPNSNATTTAFGISSNAPGT
jgi:hypothetical protein